MAGGPVTQQRYGSTQLVFIGWEQSAELVYGRTD